MIPENLELKHEFGSKLQKINIYIYKYIYLLLWALSLISYHSKASLNTVAKAKTIVSKRCNGAKSRRIFNNTIY